MLIAAVLCWCAAAATAALGGWLLVRPTVADPVKMILRTVAPTQLAAAMMLAAGGFAAVSAPPSTGLVVVIVCAAGAIGTFAAGCLHSAKIVAASEAAQPAGCAGSCASCTLSCN